MDLGSGRLGGHSQMDVTQGASNYQGLDSATKLRAASAALSYFCNSNFIYSRHF